MYLVVAVLGKALCCRCCVYVGVLCDGEGGVQVLSGGEMSERRCIEGRYERLERSFLSVYIGVLSALHQRARRGKGSRCISVCGEACVPVCSPSG